MAFDFGFDQLEGDGAGTFKGRFKWKNKPIPNSLFDIRLVVKCEEASWYEFFTDCDDPEVDVLVGGGQYVEDLVGPDNYYIVKVKEISRRTSGDCLLIKFQWDVWTTQGPVNPVTVKGKWSTPIGDVEGEGGPMSQISGQQLIRVCCEEVDGKCRPVYTIL